MREKLIQIVEYLGANAPEFINEMDSLQCHNCKYWARVAHGPRSRCLNEDMPEIWTLPDFFCANYRSK